MILQLILLKQLCKNRKSNIKHNVQKISLLKLIWLFLIDLTLFRVSYNKALKYMKQMLMYKRKKLIK